MRHRRRGDRDHRLHLRHDGAGEGHDAFAPRHPGGLRSAFRAPACAPNADDLFCGSPPLAFTFGLGGILLFPLRIGASTLLLEQADAAAPRSRGSRTIAPRSASPRPPPTAPCSACSPQHDISSLRKCVSAGEHLPLATFEAWRQATGIAIIDGIGSTELLHIFVSAPDDGDPPRARPARPCPATRCAIVDDDRPRGARRHGRPIWRCAVPPAAAISTTSSDSGRT